MSAHRRRLMCRGLLLACLAALVPAVVGLPASGSDLTGKAGVFTSLPLTDSAVTIKGRGAFSDLEITVNQTRDLVNQAISLAWKGGDPTDSSATGALFGVNYLQVMQCWGDPDGTVPENPGPPPEQCAFGAANGIFGGISGRPFPGSSLADTRIISQKRWPNFESLRSLGTFADPPGNLWRDFVAVDGTRVGNHYDPAFDPERGGVFWQNPFFNIITTNELAGARTLPNGEGSAVIEVNTGLENTGLGCGQKVQKRPDGSVVVPKCWLVVVPRGDAATENVGTAGFSDDDGVGTSPLAPAAWANRIAVPLEFSPVDTPCNLADDSTRIVGSELSLGAVASWQPVLCSIEGLRPYSYGVVSDVSARSQLVSRLPGGPGMFVTSAPLEPELMNPSSPTVYAPLTLTGITIGLNIERQPKATADAAAAALLGTRIAEVNLTPRLVAKLLTQSYLAQVEIKRLPDYPWVKDNPLYLANDEDFLRFNPEFRELAPLWGKAFSGLLLPAGSSDAAKLVWEYVLSDPEAKQWLDGTPDEWGMRVNPVYATTASVNAEGAPFAEETPDSFPKSDPYCYQAPTTPSGVVPPPLCGTDYNPFTQAFRDGARLARAATDGARLEENAFATSPDRYYSRTPPQPPGGRTMLALTDTASAALYGLQMARLSRVGDNDSDRRFIAPDTAGLQAGVAAMVPSPDEPTVLVPDQKKAATDAYPLAMLSYATVRPLELEADERVQYAAFLEYGVNQGQVQGAAYGMLPAGYSPLPAAQVAQTTAAVKTIKELRPTEEQAPPLPTPEVPGSVELPPAPSLDEPFVESFDSPSFDIGTGRPLTTDPAPVVAPVDLGTGETAAEPVTLARTPGVATPTTRLAIPVLALLALVAGFGSFEFTKRPARRAGPAPDAGSSR